MPMDASRARAACLSHVMIAAAERLGATRGWTACDGHGYSTAGGHLQLCSGGESSSCTGINDSATQRF
eukprot:SAG11_NODE_490_length_8982_cov_5.961162_5_plen_68_part_00